MKSKTIAIIAFIMLAVVAGWYYLNQDQAAKQGQTGLGGPMKVNVSTTTVQKQMVMMKLDLPGRTAAFQQSQVRPQVSGIITERLFKEGTYVKQGQQLYQLDASRYLANLKSAQANLQSAKANYKTTQARYNRIQSLEKKKAVSQQDLDDVVAQMDQAKASISVAEAAVALEQINVDYTHVYAPISGRIGKSNLTVGALVTAGQPEELATITQLNPIYVDMQLPGQESAWVQQYINDEEIIDVVLEGAAYEGVKGVLEFSDVMVDETTGSVSLRALMNNDNGTLLPGLFVNAEITLGQQQHILVPQRATTRTPDGALLVWVIDSNEKAQQKTIQVNRAQGNNWIVTAGLKSGDRVVVEGYQRLGPGSDVAATEWVANTASNDQGSRE